jgi:hypothetical protein
MQINLNAQINSSNFDPSMSNQGLWQQAMFQHHHCDSDDGCSNGQQGGLGSQIQQLEQEIQSLESQISSLQSNGASNSSQSSSSSNSGSSWGNIAQDALTAIGMFL